MKPMRVWSFFFLLYGIHCEAGQWKSSLNFNLDGTLYDHADSFHIGLRQLEQRKSEEQPTRLRAEGAMRDVWYDNVGNAFFEDESLHTTASAPTNKTNYALASLEVILKTPGPNGWADGRGESYFFHLKDEVGGREIRRDRLFSSERTRLSDDSYQRLDSKIGSLIPSKPSTFDEACYSYYHRTPHSEDKIFHLVNREFSSRSYTKRELGRLLVHGKKIRGVFLHLHTRFDMCGSCAYALDWEMQDRQGFGESIFQYCQDINQAPRLPVAVSTLVSSRQEYLVWGKSRRTLLEGPPQGQSTYGDPTYHAHYGTYSQQIDFDGPFPQRGLFAQAVLPIFDISPSPSPNALLIAQTDSPTWAPMTLLV